QQRVFVYDTLGNILDTLIHPITGNYGTRCLALDDRCPVNAPSLLNIFTWFNTGGTAIDSTGMLEIDRVNWTLRSRYRFPNASWNIRGIEYDPRDGSYWVSIMEDQTGGNNRIFKVVGFNYGTGIEESRPVPVVENTGINVSAWPNPFTRGTVLSVKLAQPGNVDLKVYDNNGRAVRELASGRQVSAQTSFPWDGRDNSGRSVAPGIYFYRVRSAGAEAWGKVVLSD
ncbi:T9SS type A sorting domain-containing protein, partial [candidate division WOR-3 bacterium]|nr:T9SS type A sorting domain-containing protein [candidate division WOR-3 bacterium]